MKVLVTGGAGYIGSHTILELLMAKHTVLSCDNYCNSSPKSLYRVSRLAQQNLESHEVDVRDEIRMPEVIADFTPDIVIHLAGLKSARASMRAPIEYYETNVLGTLQLLKAMNTSGCKKLIFSSSATVYGVPDYLPYDELHPVRPFNTYGRSKLMAETMISDWCAANDSCSALALRYFNPVGAHCSGEMGEDSIGNPENLVPFITQVAVGKKPYLNVYGRDYDTRDGTGERDYIHVVDLARAHLSAIDYVSQNLGFKALNVGSGHPLSVLELIKEFEVISGQRIPIQNRGRRQGDLPRYFADPSQAKQLLGWMSEFGLKDICRSSWLWQSKNPNGYG